MSADGEVVVGKAHSGSNEPFRWTEAGGMIGLGDLSSLSITLGEGLGASADGSVVVGDAISDDASGLEAFRWEVKDVPPDMVGLGFLPLGGLDSIAIDKGALRLLKSYSWPGNIRQLRSLLERLHVLGPGQTVTVRQLVEIGQLTDRPASPAPLDSLLQVRTEAVKRVLADAGGSVARAAEIFGVHRSTIYRWLRK